MNKCKWIIITVIFGITYGLYIHIGHQITNLKVIQEDRIKSIDNY